METIVDRIRMLCVKNKTSITKLEMEFGYANGTIGKWKNAKKRPPLEKVMEIAARLNTTADYLYNGEEIEKAPTVDGEHSDEVAELLEFYRSRPDDCRMLFSVAKTATAEDIKAAAALIEALRKKEGR